MNLKEFLKPTSTKIFVFIMLLSLSYFTLRIFALTYRCFIEIGIMCEEGKRYYIVPWISGCRKCMTEQEFEQSKISNSYKLLLWPQLYDYFFGLRPYNIAGNPLSGYLYHVFIPVIYFYLFSCLIVWGYDKLGK